MGLWSTATKYDLQLFQVRLLVFLHKCHLKHQSASQNRMREGLGITSVSGTITTALNGIGEGTSRGRAQRGLIDWGMVCSIRLDSERVYMLTEFGVEVAEHLEREIDEEPHKMKPIRSAARCTNYNKLVGRHGRED